MKLKVIKMLSFFMSYSRWLVFGAVMAGLVAGSSSAVLMMLINARVAGAIEASSSSVIKFVVLAGLVLIATTTSGLISNLLAQRTSAQLRIYLCQRILNAPLKTIENVGANQVMASLTQDITVLIGALLRVPGEDLVEVHPGADRGEVAVGHHVLEERHQVDRIAAEQHRLEERAVPQRVEELGDADVGEHLLGDLGAERVRRQVRHEHVEREAVGHARFGQQLGRIAHSGAHGRGSARPASGRLWGEAQAPRRLAGARVAYVQVAGGALPLSLSDTIPQLAPQESAGRQVRLAPTQWFPALMWR